MSWRTFLVLYRVTVRWGRSWEVFFFIYMMSCHFLWYQLWDISYVKMFHRHVLSACYYLPIMFLMYTTLRSYVMHYWCMDKALSEPWNPIGSWEIEIVLRIAIYNSNLISDNYDLLSTNQFIFHSLRPSFSRMLNIYFFQFILASRYNPWNI